MTPRAGFSTRADDAHGLVYSARGNVLPGGMNAQTTFNSEIIVDNFAGGGGARTETLWINYELQMTMMWGGRPQGGGQGHSHRTADRADPGGGGGAGRDPALRCR